MSDVRGYTSIAEVTDPTELAAQLNEHRAAMADVLLAEGGTLMQFVGDAVLAVFGAPFPQPDHARRAVLTAGLMHRAQNALNVRWQRQGMSPFGLGIGICTGDVAAALLGSEERLEYSLVGDTVNVTQRIQEWAEAGQTILTDATFRAAGSPPGATPLAPAPVKGRSRPVAAYRIGAAAEIATAAGP